MIYCGKKCKGIAPISIFFFFFPVIKIVITGNLPAVVSIEFYAFRKIVINCIKFKILFPAAFDRASPARQVQRMSLLPLRFHS